MNVLHPDPSIRTPRNRQAGADFETRLRKAFDIALIVAMVAAPFLIVGLGTDDPQQLAAGKQAIALMGQVQTPGP